MSEWLMPILVGGVIMGLIATIYKIVTTRISNIEKWKDGRPRTEEILTRVEHLDLCHRNTDRIIAMMREQHQEMRAWFELRIENVLLKEIRKINGNFQHK